MRTIQRYDNRKLYDTQQHHYVTLGHLAQIVREGEDVQVVDHVTGADRTAQTMAQIIFEEEKLAPRLGAEGLSKIIREGLAA
jgi:polyhydroxyalkanoate synthesis repressor PhaR